MLIGQLELIRSLTLVLTSAKVFCECRSRSLVVIWTRVVPGGGGASAVALVSRRIALHSLVGIGRVTDHAYVDYRIVVKRPNVSLRTP